MPSNHLVLCRPLLLLPSVFPSIRVFSSESVLRIRWPKCWSFSFSISPSNEYSGLILGLTSLGCLKDAAHQNLMRAAEKKKLCKCYMRPNHLLGSAFEVSPESALEVICGEQGTAEAGDGTTAGGDRQMWTESQITQRE